MNISKRNWAPARLVGISCFISMALMGNHVFATDGENKNPEPFLSKQQTSQQFKAADTLTPKQITDITATKNQLRRGQSRYDVPTQSLETVTPEVFNGDIRDLPKNKEWQPGDPLTFNNRGTAGDEKARPTVLNKPKESLDALLNIQEVAFKGFNQRAFGTPIVNVTGQGVAGRLPLDTHGDVGENYFIQSINANGGASFAVYDKTDGSVVSAATPMASLIGSTECSTAPRGDGIVKYDAFAKRWLMTHFSDFSNGAPHFLCMYLSQTSNPVTGGWYAYPFSFPEAPDYPKYGVWPNAYVVTSNQFGASPADVRLYVFERAKMLTGGTVRTIFADAPRYIGNDFQTILPAHAAGPLPPSENTRAIFMRHNDDEINSPASNNSQHDFLEIFEAQIDWDDTSNMTFFVPSPIEIGEFNSSFCGGGGDGCLIQPNGQGLDTISTVLMSGLQYRNFGALETLVGNMTTDARNSDTASVRWFELHRENGGTWELHQEGTYGPDTNHRWMGSIAMDISGNLALGYSEMSSTKQASIAYTGRLASDPLGVMTQAETELVAGAGSQASASRWGDYSAMTVDSTDGCSFWYTTQYVNSSNQIATGLSSFKFDSCGPEPGFCGDGIVALGEDCDDGNAINGDGCSLSCDVELGFTCTTPDAEMVNALLDGSFEAGAPNGFWSQESSIPNGEVICDDVTLCGVVDSAHDGSNYVRFGVNSSGVLEQEIFQSVIIPENATGIGYSVRLAECVDPSDTFSVYVDGVFASLLDVPSCGQDDYINFLTPLANLPGGPYNDGEAHVIGFRSKTSAINSLSSKFLVDSVKIIREQDRPSVCVARDVCYSEDFDPGVSGAVADVGWQNIPLANNTLEWGTTDDGICGSVNGTPGNFTDGFGEALCVDSDAFGSTPQTAVICSPEINLSSATGSTIDLNLNYQVFSETGEDNFTVGIGTQPPTEASLENYDIAYVVTNDQGGFSSAPGVNVSVDASSLDGATSAWVCLQYSGDFDWYAQVDDFAVTAQSCSAPDTDQDGIVDSMDNCVNVANPTQLDVDGDGFGNICDADFDNNCTVNFLDLSMFGPQFLGTNALFDMNGDGVVNFLDYILVTPFFQSPPGPSGVPTICDSEVVTVYFNEADWVAALEGQIETFDTTSTNVSLATEVLDPPGANAQLCAPLAFEECALTFTTASTSLCHGFEVRSFGGFTFEDNEFAVALPGSLSIGDVNNEEDDNFEFKNIGVNPIEGIAFNLIDNDSNVGESLTVYGEDGAVLRVIDGTTIPTGSNGAATFVGLVSEKPIGRILFDEDPGGDDIAISNFKFDDCR